MKNILVTGGSGFIGTNFIKYAYNKYNDWHIVNLDALTYAGNPMNHMEFKKDPRYTFIHGNICDASLLKKLFDKFQFNGVFHFAAESHVDRSISDPEIFLKTNVLGSFKLLKASLDYMEDYGTADFKFIHVSTDEVYGSLGAGDAAFTEKTGYNPSSPYSASKASSDHFAKAFFKTFGLPVVVTNCSNNYGPYQFPEKLIPLVILNILNKRGLPVYGKGENIRDWLYVKDHCEALAEVFEQGVCGETYNIGGGEEKKNIEVVQKICDLVDEKTGAVKSSRDLITFVKDRPGHDLRYAINCGKINQETGFFAKHSFEQALSETIDWYLGHMDWVKAVQTGEYQKWINKQYS